MHYRVRDAPEKSRQRFIGRTSQGQVVFSVSGLHPFRAADVDREMSAPLAACRYGPTTPSLIGGSRMRDADCSDVSKERTNDKRQARRRSPLANHSRDLDARPRPVWLSDTKPNLSHSTWTCTSRQPSPSHDNQPSASLTARRAVAFADPVKALVYHSVAGKAAVEARRFPSVILIFPRRCPQVCSGNDKRHSSPIGFIGLTLAPSHEPNG